MKAPQWTKEEMQILRAIWESENTIKAEAHRLPGRSLIAIKLALWNAGWGRKKRGDTSYIWPMIVKELEDAPGLTARELEKKLGTGYRNIIDQLIERSKGENKKVFVVRWKRVSTTFVQCWEVGGLPDAPKPPRQSIEERRYKDRLRYQKKRGNPFAVAMQQVTNPTVVTLPTSGRYAKRVIQEAA